jgi:energy-coupling factor transporter ATP-binding protein EcfA2
MVNIPPVGAALTVHYAYLNQRKTCFMYIEMAYMPQLHVETSEPLTVPQYWQKSGHSLSKAQLSLINAANPQQDFCLLTGDTASGKTHAAVLLGIQLACERPMSVGLVTAPSQAVLIHNVLEKYRQLLPQLGLVPGQDYRLSQKQIRFSNGSCIKFMPIKSPAIDLTQCQWIHAEHIHALTETQFNRLISQLNQPGADGRISGHRFFGTGLPVTPDSWQHQLFADNNPYGFRQISTLRHDNPALPDWYKNWLQTRPTTEPAEDTTTPDMQRLAEKAQALLSQFHAQHKPQPQNGEKAVNPISQNVTTGLRSTHTVS